MKEELLHFIWQYKLLKPIDLFSHSGQAIKIMKTGELNTDSGPDFFNAKIKIGNLTLAGNIEIHVNASDWLKHNHQYDAAYSSIILHVVYNNDLKKDQLKDGNFEVLELKNYIDKSILKKYEALVGSKSKLPCAKHIAAVEPLKLQAWLQRMQIERLEQKTDYIKHLFELSGHDYTQTFYLTLARNFGFKVNAEPFENLARQLPIQILLKHTQNLFQLEALLFGCAGLLEQPFKEKYLQQLQNEFEFLKKKYGLKVMKTEVWKFMRLRPANFPSVRLWQFALLIHHAPQLFSNPDKYNSLSKLTKAIQHPPVGYWINHYYPEGKEQKNIGAIGGNSIENIITNSIAPFLFFYGKQTGKDQFIDHALNCYEDLAFESNVKTRHFTSAGLKFKNSGDSQALINLFDNYCKNKRCLNCGIASQLLVNS